MRSIALLSLVALVLLLPGTAAAAGPGSTQLVSRPDGPGPAPAGYDNQSATPGALSDDGRYAVFTSAADGFAPGADPTVDNVFLRDTKTGATTFVSRSDGPDGAGVNVGAFEPDIAVTAGGHVLVTFTTSATNLVDHETGAVVPPQDTNGVGRRAAPAGRTTLVSRTGPNGAAADRQSGGSSLGVTAGGPVVAFESSAHNLGATVRNGGI